MNKKEELFALPAYTAAKLILAAFGATKFIADKAIALEDNTKDADCNLVAALSDNKALTADDATLFTEIKFFTTEDLTLKNASQALSVENSRLSSLYLIGNNSETLIPQLDKDLNDIKQLKAQLVRT